MPRNQKSLRDSWFLHIYNDFSQILSLVKKIIIVVFNPHISLVLINQNCLRDSWFVIVLSLYFNCYFTHFNLSKSTQISWQDALYTEFTFHIIKSSFSSYSFLSCITLRGPLQLTTLKIWRLYLFQFKSYGKNKNFSKQRSAFRRNEKFQVKYKGKEGTALRDKC